jgi:hypothetical protein
MSEQPTKKTPTSFNESKSTARENIEYPNYAVWQTRSGHLMYRVSDAKGKEFIQQQHRSGTGWEITKDGTFKTTISKNREDITFGKHVSYVTGAYDTTVKGDSSLRTEGTRRTTTEGDDETTVKGKSVTTAKSMNITAAEQFDIVAQSVTAKAKGMLFQSTDGPVTMSAVGDASLSSAEGSVGLSSKGGSVTVEAGSKVSVNSSETNLGGGGGQIVMKDGKVYINCGNFSEPRSVWKGRPEGQQQSEGETLTS